MRQVKRTALAMAILLGCCSGLFAQSRIAWVGNWAEAQALARSQHRLVFIHFWSQSCPPCLKLDRTVYNRPSVIRALSANYIPMKVNVIEDAEMARQMGVRRWPTDVIVTADGKEVHRGPSPLDADQYIATLDQVAAHVRIGRPVTGSASTVSAPQTAASAMSRDAPFRVPGQIAPPPGPTQSPSQPPSEPATAASYAANPYVGAQTPDPHPATPGYGGQFQAGRGTGPASSPPQVTANRFATAPNVPSGVAAQTHARSDITRPNSPQLPTSPTAPNPSVAMDGYCPVMLVETEQWVKGDVRWGAIHRGRTYLFAGPEEQKRFLAAFDKYAPGLSGYDPVKYSQQGVLVDGKRAHGVFYRNQVFLFSDETTLRQFWASPERFARVVQAEHSRHAVRPGREQR